MTSSKAETDVGTVASTGKGLEVTVGNRERLIALERTMLLIRRFEERTADMYTRAKIGGFCHLNIGEEATVAGAIGPLGSQHYVFSSYREHGHALARGSSARGVMAELFGKSTGLSHGRGGSMHLFDPGRHFMGGYGIVGGSLPLAVGLGLAINYQGLDGVVLSMFGDGASNIGSFHEALNMAKIWSTPTVFFCVNNQYGMGTRVDRASAVAEIYRKASAYDIEATRVDGMDVIATYNTTAEYVRRARQERRPMLIEALTFRFRGHSMSDPDKYRDPNEIDMWKHRDPITSFENRLLEAKIVGGAELEELRQSVEAEVADAIEFADSSTDPGLDELYDNVYCDDSEL